MSTEYLYALLGGEDAEVMKTYYPYYVDVSDVSVITARVCRVRACAGIDRVARS